MRKSLVALVGAILVIVIGFTLYTRMVEAGQWRNADGGWAYSVGRTCRDGINVSLAFFVDRPITIEVKVGAEIIAQQVLILSAQPINLDPDPASARPASGEFPYSGVFTVPWSPALAPGTEVSLTFVTVEGGEPFTWTPEQPYLVADCYLPDLSMSMTDSPDPVTPGGTLNYTLNVNNPSPYGLVTETARDSFPTSFENITIPSSGPAAPYPSVIGVAGLTGSVTGITATLTGLSHISPDDLDILLVGPRGQKVMLMSDAGGGFGINDVNLTFDDAAPAALPNSTQILPGSYKPSNYTDGTDSFPAPAPAGPYGSTLAGFNGTNPNGKWSLYVVDDLIDNTGSLADWKLTITTTSQAATVINTLPAGTTFISASGPGWTCAHSNGVITCTRGSLAAGAAPPITVAVQAPASTGTISNTATLVGSLPDPNMANNTATQQTEVNNATPTATTAPPTPTATATSIPASTGTSTPTSTPTQTVTGTPPTSTPTATPTRVVTSTPTQTRPSAWRVSLPVIRR